MEDRIFFNEEDLENYQSWVHKKAQLMAEAVKADSDDSSETKFVAKLPRPERSRKSSIPLNWPEEEANFPVSRDSVHSSQARRKSREDFSPENYIRRLQTAGSKPTVKARTVAYVENRHGVTEKLDKEKKDKIENLPGPSDSMTQYGHRDQRHYRCECNTWNFKPRKSVSHEAMVCNKRLVLTNFARYNVPIAKIGSTPCATAIILPGMNEFQIYITAIVA